MFLIIYVSILKNHSEILSGGENSSILQEKLLQIKSRLRIAVGLSVFFGLGWGFGFPATHLQKHDVSRYIFSICFNSLTAFQGFFIFVLHCIQKKEVRKEWKKWINCFLLRSNKANLSYTSQTNAKNLNVIKIKDTTDLTPPKNTYSYANPSVINEENREEASQAGSSDQGECLSRERVLQDMRIQSEDIDLVFANDTVETAETGM